MAIPIGADETKMVDVDYGSAPDDIKEIGLFVTKHEVDDITGDFSEYPGEEFEIKSLKELPKLIK